MRQPDDYAQVKAAGSPYDSLIQTAAANHGVSYDLLHKQLFKESSFNPNAKSPTGPRGIGQFTKATGLAYGLEHDEDFYNPEKSIDAAARHMRDNIQIAGGDELKALLLYNQGGGRAGRKQLEAYDRVRIPRHPATQSTLIRPGIPRTSGHLFHGHPAGQSERSDAGFALLV